MATLPTFAPNWAAIAQILGGALAAPEGQYAQGAQQGAQAYQGMQDARLNQQYRQQQLEMQKQQADREAAQFQAQQRSEQEWRDAWGAQAAPAPVRQFGNYGASVGGAPSVQTASGQSPLAQIAAGRSPQERAMMYLAGQESGLPILADWMKPQEAPQPYSGLAKLKADLDAGRIDRATYDAAVKKETYIAPQSPQQPPATNLITLVGPKGEQQSFDSRDPMVRQLTSQGWVERQNSMFPAAPSGYSYAPEGLAPIPGGPADPANPNNITGDQRKTASFATRLESANAIIDANENVGTGYLQEGLASVPFFGSKLASTEKQSLNQAQRDFINAQLRRESGATIQDTEFESAAKQYFPQPGEGAEIVAQKKEARRIAVENMKREAGAALVSGGSDGEWTVIDGVKIRKK
jgi:hypothetical protein